MKETRGLGPTAPHAHGGRGRLRVLALLVAACAAVSAAALGDQLLVRPLAGRSTRERQAERAVSAWLVAAETWRADEAGCPDAARLERDRLLEAGTSSVDPWGRNYEVHCGGDSTWVRSAGADGRFDTEDDVIARAPRGHDAPRVAAGAP